MKQIYLPSVGSTNAWMQEILMHQTWDEGTLVYTDYQTNGRGQLTNTWESEAGKNILMSMYFAPLWLPIKDQFVLSQAVALGVVDFLRQYADGFQIKWPNDIYWQHQKIAGILIEYTGRFVVVGIGINVNSNPTVDKYKTTKLDNYSEIPMNELLNRLMKNVDKWRRSDFRAVRARWTELAACLNRPVKYQGEMAELIGINENGALVLRKGTRYLLVYGDEISL